MFMTLSQHWQRQVGAPAGKTGGLRPAYRACATWTSGASTGALLRIYNAAAECRRGRRLPPFLVVVPRAPDRPRALRRAMAKNKFDNSAACIYNALLAALEKKTHTHSGIALTWPRIAWLCSSAACCVCLRRTGTGSGGTALAATAFISTTEIPRHRTSPVTPCSSTNRFRSTVPSR